MTKCDEHFEIASSLKGIKIHPSLNHAPNPRVIFFYIYIYMFIPSMPGLHSVLLWVKRNSEKMNICRSICKGYHQLKQTFLGIEKHFIC